MVTNVSPRPRQSAKRMLDTFLATRGRATVAAALQALPTPVAEFARMNLPGRLRGVLRHRGIPTTVSDFALVDSPRVRFANADSLVLQRSTGWVPRVRSHICCAGGA